MDSIEITLRCKELADTVARLTAAVKERDMPKAIGNNQLLMAQTREVQRWLLSQGMEALAGERIKAVIDGRLGTRVNGGR